MPHGLKLQQQASSQYISTPQVLSWPQALEILTHAIILNNIEQAVSIESQPFRSICCLTVKVLG